MQVDGFTLSFYAMSVSSPSAPGAAQERASVVAAPKVLMELGVGRSFAPSDGWPQ